MPDEHVPAPSPASSGGPSSPSPADITNVVPPPAELSNGASPHSDGGAHTPAPKHGHGAWPELVLLLRWLAGLLLVMVCGWGLLGLAFYVTRSRVQSPEIAFALFAVLNLGLFLLLERKFWLSRFMCLRIEPNTHPWHSAVMLWLLGVPGLLFRSTNFHTEAVAAPETATRPRPKPQTVQRNDSVREVVETIVFVVVLVLLLKSFAAEAFVIPTGSMAQTLLGYQKEVTCPDCGIKFPINCSREVEPQDGPGRQGMLMKTFACVCPNCRRRIAFRGSLKPEELEANLRRFPDTLVIDDPGWSSGDRVLVAKFVYDLLGKPPDRLDVVVFKYPGDNGFPNTGPHKGHVPMNYIKRLIGLPGETIAICGGKLYVLAPERGLQYDDYQKSRGDPEAMATLWQKPHMHQNDEEARDRFHKGEFQIVRKSPENILSMMRLVYDNDHPATKQPLLPERWVNPDRGWSADNARGFRFDGDDAEHWLRYQHLLRDNLENPPDRRLSLITDCMGYNTYEDNVHHPLLGTNWVGDLILECEATIEKPQGEFTLELSKGVDRFRARWDLTTGDCTLLRVNKQGEQKLASKRTPMSKKGDYRLRFANVDERLVVWVNNDLAFDEDVTYTPPPADQIGPTEENDLERPASVGAKGAAVAVHKLKLFRDTYYTVGGTEWNTPNEGDVPGVTFTDPTTWRGLRTPPVLTLYVQPEHFLCLGDNSPESSDGRSWGAVPQRLLLGRALLVYYPFGRAGRIR